MIEKLLSGKVATITGANQGLGREIAKKFVNAGADVMLCARNYSLLENTQQELAALLGENQQILIKKCDVSNEDEVKALANEIFDKLGGCHILVNNAGIYGPKGAIEDQDWNEWKKTLEINVYGSVLMCRSLIPHFKKQKYGKIIQLSGGGATNPLPNISAYAVSKAAIVRFAETLAEEVRGFGIDVNAIAPGALNTGMLQEVLVSGPDKVGKIFYEKALAQKKNGGVPLIKGADLALFLASSTSDGITGKLISAVWDKWENWPEYLDELNNSDAYTLRRIVGRDRGLDWGDV
jgi:NAD(P)-dependent dehydrogenase (short-subunit alcohol dehydrogenase family)